MNPVNLESTLRRWEKAIMALVCKGVVMGEIWNKLCAVCPGCGHKHSDPHDNIAQSGGEEFPCEGCGRHLSAWYYKGEYLCKTRPGPWVYLGIISAGLAVGFGLLLFLMRNH